MIDHRDTMLQLAQEKGWRQGIELGLGQGMLFRRFLSAGIRMIGVDMGMRPDRRATVEEMQADPVLMQHIEAIYWLSTNQAAPLVPDGWADFIFIDAAHSYEAVRDDIANWLPKLAPGGWFGGHDYHESWPGVVRAVNEAFGPDGFYQLDWFIWVRRA